MKIEKIAFLLYLLINALFVDKYSARLVDYHWVVSCAYLLCASAALWLLPRFIQRLSRPLLWLCILSGLFLAAGVVLQYAIDPMGLQVDRWSAIHHFLDGVLAGIYPYGQQTHLGGYGSPLPVWQLLHLPFYAIGNVGLSIILVLGLLIYTVAKTRGIRQALALGLLLMISPAVWYEIAVRSDLITNIMLVCLIAEWLAYKQVRLSSDLVAIALLSGLLLSTRLVAVIPLAVMYGYEFLRMGWRKQLLFVVLVAASFALTILPFVFWQGSTLLFFEYNPFVLQTRQGSALSMVLWLVLAVWMVLYVKGKESARVLTTGLVLTCLVVLAFVCKMWMENAWCDLYTSTFDITYLSLGLPFYALHIATRRFEKL
jgi:hypothetical protein